MKIRNMTIRSVYNKLMMKVCYPILNLFTELFTKNYKIITASVNPLEHNWGDDMSRQIIHLINPKLKTVINRYSFNIRNYDDYLCIGSIISWMTSSKSVIWGSGVVYPNQKLKFKPKEVLAVRGPLTRKYLLEQGVPCPEIYGDPALLFPRYYTPPVDCKDILISEKPYKIGIIPHFRDKNNLLIKKIGNYKDVLIIDVANIKPWHRFIDQINSCAYIVSSSLHGIILSDAYGIPNAWVEFKDGERKRFAFIDYMMSVGRREKEGFLIDENITIEALIRQCQEWKGIDIDLDKLMNTCPFLDI